ncbi:hypothetical protein BH09PAT4_BH09PAT4_01940 [soil metagenome]
MAKKDTISTSRETSSLLEGPPRATKDYVDETLKEHSQELRKDFIAIFGIFAAFLTFTVVQIGVLIQKTTMSLTMGAASFFLASSLTFVLALQYLVSGRKISPGEAARLTILLLLIITVFFFSFECFWYATHHKSLWP